jgi:hypothetical protein
VFPGDDPFVVHEETNVHIKGRSWSHGKSESCEEDVEYEYVDGGPRECSPDLAQLLDMEEAESIFPDMDDVTEDWKDTLERTHDGDWDDPDEVYMHGSLFFLYEKASFMQRLEDDARNANEDGYSNALLHALSCILGVSDRGSNVEEE